MFEFFNQDAIREQRNNAAVKVQAAARRFLAVRREAGRAAAAAVIQRSVRERQGLMRKDTEEVPCKEARAAAADLDEDELAALALPHVKRQFVLLVLIALAYASDKTRGDGINPRLTSAPNVGRRAGL